VMHEHLIRHPEGFGVGYTPLTRRGEADDTGIDMGIHVLAAGEAFAETTDLETAWLLLDGTARFRCREIDVCASRSSLFDQEPWALHVPRGVAVEIVAETAVELCRCRVENDASFAARTFDPASMLESEHRGKGMWSDTAYRMVRAIFDRRNRPEANLVLGEVITFPGRWSSYPPHHHPQPEIYHYRFTEPQGYGHAELGDDVLKIRQYDTLKILDARDHPQVAAPGYGMYYIWVIRHLPGRPYEGFEFTDEHAWLMQPGHRIWEPET
jgi:5-deoxy-glucuronate isomerase